MGKVLLGRQLRSLGHRGLRYDFLKRKQRKNCECCPVSKLIVKFSIVRILISVSNVTSLQDCLFNCQNCPNCLSCQKLSKIVKIIKNCQKLSKLSKVVKNCQNVSQVMLPHHCDQMCQRSQVSRVAL